MSPSAYFFEVLKRSFRAAKKAVHELHFWLLIAAGIALVLVNVHLEEYILAILLPLFVFLAVFIGSMFWQGYRIYREEEERRLASESQLSGQIEGLKSAQAAVDPVAEERRSEARSQIAKLTPTERLVVKRLLVMGPQLEQDLRGYLRGCGHACDENIGQVVATKSGLLVRTSEGRFREGRWVLRSELAPFIADALQQVAGS
jgi:hypothetical protein